MSASCYTPRGQYKPNSLPVPARGEYSYIGTRNSVKKCNASTIPKTFKTAKPINLLTAGPLTMKPKTTSVLVSSDEVIDSIYYLHI